jgi:hypothetical protein
MEPQYTGNIDISKSKACGAIREYAIAPYACCLGSNKLLAGC